MTPRLRPTSAPSGILIHTAVWQQQTSAENWGYVPFFLGGGAGSSSNTRSPGLRPTSTPSGILMHPNIQPQQIWAENWGQCPFWGGEAGSPSNTVWPGLRPTCVPSFILIHPTVWPQYTNVTDRTGQTDRQTDRQWSHSTCRPKMECTLYQVICVYSAITVNECSIIPNNYHF